MSIDNWNREAIGPAKLLLSSLIILEWILSRPGDLYGFSLLIYFVTVSVVMFNWGIDNWLFAIWGACGSYPY